MDKYTLIFETKAGSHLYGTNIPTSDLDYRGVVFEPLTALLGIQPFEQKEFPKPEDKVYYGLRKFISLALQCNPNIIELLFAGENAITYATYEWDIILANRHLFLNKHAIVKNFCGYALDQFKRMETHHRWMIDEKPEKPNPADYGRVLNEDGSEKWTLVHLKNEYENKKKNWDTYSTWLANRNKIRHDLEEQFGYDCYTDDTQFLTESGWKFYDEISDTVKIATLNQATHSIEFQRFTERVKKKYNGLVYELDTLNSNCRVTSNHRMFISRVHSKASNNFSTKADNNWIIKSLKSLISDRNSRYHIKTLYENDNPEYNITDTELMLVGAYISEGSIGWNNNGTVKEARITQTNHGKSEFYSMMKRISDDFICRQYNYKRKEKDLIETTWAFPTDIGKRLIALCDCGSENKHLPFYFQRLSKRQANILLTAAILGDGTYNKSNRVYYTNSKRLADDIQILANLAGYNANVLNYLDKHKIIQVQISNIIRYTNYKPINDANLITAEYNGNIVCFTVPNEILITRRKGKIAIQGNTKNALHLVRLLQQGEELLNTGNMTLPRPNAKELLAIRYGSMTYENIEAYLIMKMNELREIENTSNLPSKPDYNKVEEMVMELNYQYIRNNYGL